MFRFRFCLTPVFVLILIHHSYSGVTGTLAGRVTDKTTGKSLAGANITIMNTYLGAAADLDGFFLINNIPGGKYDVNVRMIGYNSIIQEDVVILMDLRTTIEFELEPTILELEQVVIQAESPMIQKDVTATTHFITNQELEHLPVQSFQEIVEIQPGVAAGHIRGGRNNEILYLVDGFPVQEAIEGKVGSELPISSIIDMTVQTGGFNAEYGNAMSGVINILTREGTDKFDANGQISAIRYSYQNPFSDHSNEPDYISEFNIGGAIGPQHLKYFLSADARVPNTQWKREDFGQRLLIFNNDKSCNTNINGKLTYHPGKSWKLTLQGLFSYWRWNEYDNRWKFNLAGLPDRSKKSYRTSMTAVHTITPQMFYEIRFSRYNVLKSIAGESSRNQAPIVYMNNDPQSWVIAGDYPWWLDHEEIHNTFKFDLTSQLTHFHQIKAGAEIVHYDLNKKSVQRVTVDNTDLNFPQYISYVVDYNYQPIMGAVYIQDKIDYDGLIANIGLRYDFLDPRAERPALEEALENEQDGWIISSTKTVKASVKRQLSPRLGIAYPMGENRELHVNFGYFFQMPLFDYLYKNANINPLEGFAPLKYPDLKPSRSVSFEISYKHQLNENTLLDATAFKKEVSNLIDNNTYVVGNSGALSGTGYYNYVNAEIADIHGTELYIKRRVGQLISGKISYTFMVAQGSGATRTDKFEWLTKTTRLRVNEYYLSWDQRHTLVLNLDVRRANKWGINLLWTWNSPLPYTKFEGDRTIPNSGRMTATSSLDVRLNRDWQIYQFPITAFAEFLNVFNNKNVLWVDSRGVPGGSLADPSAWDQRFRFRLGLNINF
ncbi:TonB-dependent receptor [candidate division KSB1 bacterium]|nr:TonB-dependent receptor [candidate division KSB1 bacterium]